MYKKHNQHHHTHPPKTSSAYFKAAPHMAPSRNLAFISWVSLWEESFYCRVHIKGPDFWKSPFGPSGFNLPAVKLFQQGVQARSAALSTQSQWVQVLIYDMLWLVLGGWYLTYRYWDPLTKASNKRLHERSIVLQSILGWSTGRCDVLIRNLTKIRPTQPGSLREVSVSFTDLV